MRVGCSDVAHGVSRLQLSRARLCRVVSVSIDVARDRIRPGPILSDVTRARVEEHGPECGPSYPRILHHHGPI